MKKLFLLAACSCLLVSGFAQNVSFKTPPDVRSDRTLSGSSRSLDKAERHFNNHYRGSTVVSWTTLAGTGFVCKFEDADRVNHVHYDKHGNWICTISGYSAEVLPKQVREMVQGCYEGYRITYVNEVSSKAAEPVYIINIESFSSYKVIRVAGDEMDVRKEMEKE
jgi:hypothetical protein